MRISWHHGLVLDDVTVPPHIASAVISAQALLNPGCDVVIEKLPEPALRLVVSALRNAGTCGCAVAERSGGWEEVDVSPKAFASPVA